MVPLLPCRTARPRSTGELASMPSLVFVIGESGASDRRISTAGFLIRFLESRTASLLLSVVDTNENVIDELESFSRGKFDSLFLELRGFLVLEYDRLLRYC